MRHTSFRQIQSRQAGMVSIMVTMLLMVVVSLIVLGFAQLSRREQTESLDRQLSTQAFLAAESGINDARKIVQKQIADGQPIKAKTTCGPNTDYPIATVNPALGDGVSYSCLLVKTNVKSLEGDIDPNGASMVLPLQSASNLSNITITWKPGAGTFSSCPTSVADKAFPTTAAWACPYGVLRAEFVPTGTTLSRAAMTAGQKVTYLYPVSGGGGSTGFASIDGTITPMSCTAALCSITMNGFNANNYMVKLTPVYKAGHFSITGNGGTVDLLNAQVQIDATGRAQDVLRRIQVRIPVSSTNQGAEQALSSGGSVCKRFQFDGASYSVPAITGHTVNDLNPMCRPLSVIPVVPPSCTKENDIMLVMDVSHSMTNVKFDGNQTRYDKMKELTKKFITATVSPSNPASNIEGIITFGGEVEDKFNMTASQSELLDDVDNFGDNYGTKYLPPLNEVLSQFTTGAARPTAPRIMIFASDGETTTNIPEVLALTDSFKTSNMTIYTIGIGEDDNFDTLQKMAANSPNKGRFFNVKDTAAFNAAIDDITKDVNCQ